MPNARFALPIIAILGLAAPVLAEESPQKLEDMDATRINAFQILIEFDYEGGACEAAQPAKLGDLTGGVLGVTIPVLATSEVCTMQITKNEVKQAIETRDEVTGLDITLLAPDGRVIGQGSTDVMPD
jgi:hypothetical protein